MKNLKSIGEVYLESNFFNENDQAAKTIGQPLIGENVNEIFENRRKIKGILTPLGKQKLNDIISEIKIIFKTDNVKAVWDKHCGCSMCPCSPGFRIKIASEAVRYGGGRDKDRFNLHISNNGFTFYKPKDSWMIGYDNVSELEKIFKK